MQTINKDNNQPVFQGDVMFTRVDALPEGLKKKADCIVAHSETGHHHVAEAALAPHVFECDDGRTLYMRALGESVDVVHKRPFDTHETVRLLGEPGQVWRIRRQREYVPEGWRMVAD